MGTVSAVDGKEGSPVSLGPPFPGTDSQEACGGDREGLAESPLRGYGVWSEFEWVGGRAHGEQGAEGAGGLSVCTVADPLLRRAREGWR